MFAPNPRKSLRATTLSVGDLRPGRRVFVHSDSKMQRFESRRPSGCARNAANGGVSFIRTWSPSPETGEDAGFQCLSLRRIVWCLLSRRGRLPSDDVDRMATLSPLSLTAPVGDAGPRVFGIPRCRARCTWQQVMLGDGSATGHIAQPMSNGADLILYRGKRVKYEGRSKTARYREISMYLAPIASASNSGSDSVQTSNVSTTTPLILFWYSKRNESMTAMDADRSLLGEVTMFKRRIWLSSDKLT